MPLDQHTRDFSIFAKKASTFMTGIHERRQNGYYYDSLDAGRVCCDYCLHIRDWFLLGIARYVSLLELLSFLIKVESFRLSSFLRKDIYEKRTRLHNFNSYDDLVINLYNHKWDIYTSDEPVYVNSRKKQAVL